MQCLRCFYYRKDNLVNDVYDHMVTVIIDMTKDERAREAGSRIYNMYRRHFYKQLEDHKVSSKHRTP